MSVDVYHTEECHEQTLRIVYKCKPRYAKEHACERIACNHTRHFTQTHVKKAHPLSGGIWTEAEENPYLVHY